MGFLDERPVAKIVSGTILVISTIAVLGGTIPEQSMDIATTLIGLSGGFLFGNSVSGAIKRA